MVLQQWVANTEQRVAGRRWGRCRGGEGGGGERRNGCTGTHGTSISNYSALFRRPSCCCKRCSQEVPTIDFSQGRERHRREGGGRRELSQAVKSDRKTANNADDRDWFSSPSPASPPGSSLASTVGFGLRLSVSQRALVGHGPTTGRSSCPSAVNAGTTLRPWSLALAVWSCHLKSAGVLFTVMLTIELLSSTHFQSQANRICNLL